MRDRLPWFVWTSLASVSCIVIGLYWDISWHQTIGRDTFWTPAHIAIQAGGLIAGLSGALLIFATTFHPGAAARDASIHVWGFRGPFGAFLGAWGAATMGVSAPFDNWWHDAYGLDVQILSPPHTVLLVGILSVAVAGVLLVLAAMNRATGALRARLGLAVLVLGGEVVVLAMTAVLQSTSRSRLHSAEPYRAMAIAVPVVLVAIGGAANRRWGASLLATFYMAFMIAMLWLLRQFPAAPKLGPVYQPISHFVPLQFPQLLIAPAFAIDVARERFAHWRRWRLALVIGLVFVVVLVAAEWPFADFLQSPAARNGWFGGGDLAYFARPESASARHEFVHDPALLTGLLEALGAASLTAYLGLALGDLLRRVRR